VNEASSLAAPAQQFIDDLTALGTPARLDGGRILYEVLAVGGALKGQKVTTGVSVTELLSWPMVPPHWIHLPDSVNFDATNMDETDCLPGWKRHSRDFNFTDMSMPPALAWLRHVRGFVSIAIAKAA
jgi:hypothetical protein